MINEITKINATYSNHLNSMNQQNNMMQSSILRRNRYKKKKLEPIKLSEVR